MTIDLSWRARLRTFAGRQEARTELLAALAAIDDDSPEVVAEETEGPPPQLADLERDDYIRNYVWDTLDEIRDALDPLPRIPDTPPNLALEVSGIVDEMVSAVPPLPELPPVVWRCGRSCTAPGQLCQRDEGHEGACSHRDRRRSEASRPPVTHPLLTELATLATPEAWPFLRGKVAKNA